MILSAVSVWKKFDMSNPLCPSEWGGTEDSAAGMRFWNVTYYGRKANDGSVRVFARFGKPSAGEKFPAVLLLPEAGKPLDDELLYYFIDKGYAVLMPDYSGEREGAAENAPRTVYPESLKYADFVRAGGYDRVDTTADETCWFEWISVALYSIEYLKQRGDVSGIGVVGIRTGGEIAWKAMLSPDVKCGVPINAAGWRAYRNIGKFADNAEINMSDERHRYIAGIESQSYAPFVKCPVLMLCALHDDGFDYDRAYDTYSRIGCEDGNAIAYSADSGSCIGPNALKDLDLFLEKHLKGREIYIPKSLNVALKFEDDTLKAEVEYDDGGILEETGIYYAESSEKTKATFREWHCAFRTEGKNVKNGKLSCELPRYKGAAISFVFAYAKYINGFRVASKIAAKRFADPDPKAVRSRVLYSGEEVDCFGVAGYEDYSIADIFLECEAVPKLTEGYGRIKGAYSVGGIKTYKISSPRYVPEENAMLEFDVYFRKDGELKVSVDIADEENRTERFSCFVPVRGGGKWKRIILSPNEFKDEGMGAPLKSFSQGQALLFDCEDETNEYAVTNILWL